MIKKLLFIGAVFIALSVHAQSVKAKIGTGGNFLILDDGTPGTDELVKLLISEEGEVKWYLDKQNMFIQDGLFEAYPTDPDSAGVLYRYDFVKIDGINGRIAFNALDGRVDQSVYQGPIDPLTSSVSLYGSIATRVRLLDGSNSYEIRQDDHIMVVDQQANNNTTMDLPTVASCKGRQYTIKRNNFNDGKIIVAPASGEKLNGVVGGTVIMTNDNSSLEVVCDGDSWWVISEQGVAAQAYTTSVDAIAGSIEYIEVNFTTASETIDISLPKASEYEGKEYKIKRNANGSTFLSDVLRIIPQSGEFLDSASNASPYLMSNDFESVTVRSNGSRWLIMSSHGH